MPEIDVDVDAGDAGAEGNGDVDPDEAGFDDEVAENRSIGAGVPRGAKSRVMVEVDVGPRFDSNRHGHRQSPVTA